MLKEKGNTSGYLQVAKETAQEVRALEMRNIWSVMAKYDLEFAHVNQLGKFRKAINFEDAGMLLEDLFELAADGNMSSIEKEHVLLYVQLQKLLDIVSGNYDEARPATLMINARPGTDAFKKELLNT